MTFKSRKYGKKWIYFIRAGRKTLQRWEGGETRVSAAIDNDCLALQGAYCCWCVSQCVRRLNDSCTTAGRALDSGLSSTFEINAVIRAGGVGWSIAVRITCVRRRRRCRQTENSVEYTGRTGNRRWSRDNCFRVNIPVAALCSGLAHIVWAFDINGWGGRWVGRWNHGLAPCYVVYFLFLLVCTAVCTR